MRMDTSNPMKERLHQLPDAASRKRKVHREFLAKLRKKPPRDLDYTMQALHEAEFTRTNCLECANCCKTTGPLITPADLDRIAKHLRMKPGRFVSEYLRQDEDGDWVLQQLPCPFLALDNSCGIYSVRPKACREYPHTDRRKFHQIADLTLKNVAICPAAFAIVENMLERINI